MYQLLRRKATQVLETCSLMENQETYYYVLQIEKQILKAITEAKNGWRYTSIKQLP